MSDDPRLEMSSVEAQLCVLYAEKQRLEEELGSSDTDEILALIEDLNARIAELEVDGDRTGELDELDALRVQLAELVAEREAFLLSVDADSLDEVRERIHERPTQSRTTTAPMTQREDFEVEDTIEDAIEMANDVSDQFSRTEPSVQDALTIANDLRTMAEQLGTVFTNSKVTFTGRLHGGQWKLECHNG